MNRVVELLMDHGIPSATRRPLSALSYWKIGGCADVFCAPRNAHELGKVLTVIREVGTPFIVIGDGSNLLFDDDGFRGVVIKIGGAFSSLDFLPDEKVYAGAGNWVPCLARRVGARGLSGLEHTVGIPGRLGGLLMMNGGSQRKSIGSNVLEVECVKHSGELVRISREECDFRYRSSSLDKGDLVVVGALLKFERRDRAQILHEMRNILRDRSSKFPRKMPNCGSVFLSKPNMYSELGPPGKIIESVGLKGVQIGGAKVSEKHANFIVNCGSAMSRDVLQLIHYVRDVVLDRTGYVLECEVRHVSPLGEVRPAHHVR